MKGVKTPPPSNKGGKKSSQSTPAVSVPEDVCSIICALQPRSDDPTVDRCMIPASFIKKLGGIRIGSYALVTFPSGAVALFAMWPHGRQKVTADAASFHRIWGPNFDSREFQSPGSVKSVQISSKYMNRIRVLPSISISCYVIDNRNRLEEIKKSANFRSILKSYLLNVHIRKGLKLSVTFQGGPVTVVIKESYVDESIPTRSAREEGSHTDENGLLDNELITFHLFNSKTEILIVDELDDHNVNDSALEGNSQMGTTPQKWSHAVIKERVYTSFAGYHQEANEIIELVISGLCAIKGQSRPKGAIICGPPGTGKSQLLQSLLQALRCNVKYLDHSLLLRALEGEAETMLRQCFEEASRIPPCCIVMENMDLLLPSRAASTTTFLQKRITSCWLSIMDDLPAGVFVLGVSTRVNDLDAAVRRAGRMEREIEIGVPSPADRLHILTHLFIRAGALILPSSPSLQEVVTNTQQTVEISESLVQQTAAAAHGTVGADLLTLVKEIFYQNILCRQNDVSDIESSMKSLSLTAQESSISSTQHVVISDIAIRNALRKVSPSALREVVVEVPTVHWTDIGGMSGVKEALQQVVEWPLKHPEWYASLQIGALKGVLLYGPPGCSKTLMAKAIATESSMNFLAVRGPELLSKWLGESEKAVQALFRRARAASPAIIFFDEIDALAGVRGEMSSGVSDRVLAQLLTELDGIEALKQVVVIAATNRPDMLDPALIRPGRIDRKIYVPPPDAESRRSILTIELQKMPVAPIVATVEEVMDEEMIWMDELVELTNGYSGAEVVALCSESALLAVEMEGEYLTRNHLITAAGKIKPQITADMLQFYENFRMKHR